MPGNLGIAEELRLTGDVTDASSNDVTGPSDDVTNRRTHIGGEVDKSLGLDER